MSLPASIDLASALTFFSATLVKWSMSPACSHGAPQHPASDTTPTSMPLRSYTWVVPQPVLTKEKLSGDLVGKTVLWTVYDQMGPIAGGVLGAVAFRLAFG